MIWLIKPEGLYDTYEHDEIDLSDYFEEEEPWEWKLGTYAGWRIRPVQR